MIYPADLPCVLLRGNKPQGGRTFLRSGFEYATRQRQTYCNDYMYSASFLMKDRDTMIKFKNFYYSSLKNGSMSFEAEWEVEGLPGVKKFRFADVYSATPVGNGLYSVSATFEMITKIKDL